METLLTALRAAAEPTRLRILALAASGAFCVTEFTDILGQSQPRLSRHLKLLCEAGLLERVREGANAWFAAPVGEAGALTRQLAARLPPDDPILQADRREAARVLAERARIASESFQKQGADWDEMRALGLPAEAVEASLAQLVPPGTGRLLDIGTGTGRVLELLGPCVREGLGVDASKQMLALARARLARAALAHCSVRLADMYRLPLPDSGFDVAVLQMVLHHAEDPGRVINEAARVLRPGGQLIVVELAAHRQADTVQRLAHRWPGFLAAELAAWMEQAGMVCGRGTAIPGDGPLRVRTWIGTRTADASAARVAELVV